MSHDTLRRSGQSGGDVVQPRHHNNPNLLTRWTRMLAAPSGDWSVFQQIFADHWEAFQHAHPRYQTPYYHGLVGKMLACGNPAKIGYREYRCLHCGQGKHVVAMSCKSSLCLRCAKVAVDNWVSQVSQGPPRRRHLSAYHPDGAGDVPHDLLPERGGRVECVDTLRGAMPRRFLQHRQGEGAQGGLHHGAPHAWPQWALSSPSACARHQWGL